MKFTYFDQYIAEAKDAKKAKENADLQKNDASHGEKADNLDKSINEADTQKAKENAELQKNDASHGNKADNLDTKVKADGNNYEGDKPDNLDPSINEKKEVLHGDKEDGEDHEDDDCDDEETKKLKESMSLNEAVQKIGKKIMFSTDGMGGIQIAIVDPMTNKWTTPIVLDRKEYSEFLTKLPESK